MRTHKTVSLFILFIPMAFGCQDTMLTPPDHQDGLSTTQLNLEPCLVVTPQILELEVGEEGRFSAQLLLLQVHSPCQGMIHWRSLNPEIASVDAHGTAHALTRGMALIEVEAGGLTAEAWIRVK